MSASMPAGVVTTADLIKHYAAVRQRLARAHLRLVPKITRPPSLSVSIWRPAPELQIIPFYAQAVCAACGEPPILPIRRAPLGIIIKAVADEFGVTPMLIISPLRGKKYSLPRHVAIYLCRKLTPKSFPQLGAKFGGRDHTTILYAVGKIERLVAADPDFAATVAAIRTKLVGCG
jgi:hypothetical protein